MSSQTVAQCSASFRALSNTARTLRRIILDNEPKAGRIDEYALTHLSEQWTTKRAEYDKLLDASEAAAIKLAATIKYYISLQGDVNDPDAVTDLIEELSALDAKLQGLNLDQTSDFDALRSSFEQLISDLAPAVKQRDAEAQSELNAAQAEVTSLEKQLQEINAKIELDNEQEVEDVMSAATSTLGSLFRGLGKDRKPKTATTTPTSEDDKAAKDRNAAELKKAKASVAAAAGKVLIGGKDQNKAQLYAIKEKLNVAQARLVKANSVTRARDAADIDSFLKANEEIQKGLDAQIEQFQAFPSLTRQLTTEVTNYLAAFEAIKSDPSVDNQRTLSNLSRKVALASGPWKEVASLLVDEYAKNKK